MLHKIRVGLFYAAASLSTCVYSMEVHSLQQGITVEYELPSNNPQIFINYMFWAVEAYCKITTQDDSNEFLVEGLAKKGKVNDTFISAGDSLKICVHQSDNLKLRAESGAKVALTNLGQHTVKAACTA